MLWLPPLLAALVYFAAAASPVALLDDADSVHAEAAREILERSDWVTLYANGIRYLEKAPLIYWAMALAFKIFGVSEFAARIPIAMAAVLLVTVVVAFGNWAFGRRAAVFAGLALASSPGLFLFTRITLPDVILTLCMTGALYCFLRAREEDRGEPWWMLGVYACSALGVLTKGLIGVIFPAAIIGINILVNRDWIAFKRARWFRGTLVFLAVAAPWHLLAGVRTKTFFWFYFVNEHFLRYLGRRHPFDYDTVPRPLFWGLHSVWFFPWIVLLAYAVKSAVSSWQMEEKTGRSVRLLSIWIAVVMLFFSFSTTQEYYSMPIYPALALLIGWGMARAETREEGWNLWGLRLAGILMMVVSISAGIVLYAIRTEKVIGDISSRLGRNPEHYALSLGHVMDLNLAALAELRYHLFGTCLVFGIGAAAVWFFTRRRSTMGSAIAISMVLAGFFHVAEQARDVFGPYLSSKPIAGFLNARLQPDDRLILNGEYESGSSINFYTQRQVYILNGRAANLEYGSYFPDAPHLFYQDHDLVELWRAQHRVYLITPGEGRERIESLLPAGVYMVFESGGKLVLSNRPG
ncbi:MAG: glycosyltransferase family 39 protein [Acidobacteria bacterium]|nr:glycosyltransferase family 39 protein [Acidobacteriota bacterium]